ncbi:MAG: META domain-containing protein [Hyphomicrobiales bacterium]|nr:META domain-containing protein [Hyphomicrobiales bacterium]MDE2017280.1 META domain-containing protein [Hyphomicrobiales bacterium]
MRQVRIATAAALALCAAQAPAIAKIRGPDKAPTRLAPYIAPFPTDQTWILETLNGKPVPSGLDASLTISAAFRATGFTGCNTWSATIYPTKDQRLAAGPIAITKSKCDKTLMKFEFDYLSAIASGPHWVRDGGELLLKGPRGELRFGRSL